MDPAYYDEKGHCSDFDDVVFDQNNTQNQWNNQNTDPNIQDIIKWISEYQHETIEKYFDLITRFLDAENTSQQVLQATQKCIQSYVFNAYVPYPVSPSLILAILCHSKAYALAITTSICQNIAHLTEQKLVPIYSAFKQRAEELIVRPDYCKYKPGKQIWNTLMFTTNDIIQELKDPVQIQELKDLQSFCIGKLQQIKKNKSALIKSPPIKMRASASKLRQSESCEEAAKLSQLERMDSIDSDE